MPGYRTFRISDDTALDVVRALWIATVLNRREGYTGSPRSQECEAMSRIVREWASVTIASVAHDPEFMALVDADWRCTVPGCGSTGLGGGGLTVTPVGVTCQPCRENASRTR